MSSKYFKDVMKDVHWGKFGGALAVGAVVGGAYSLFDQTVLHRKKASAKDPLPGVTDFLQRAAPDIVRKMQHFYLFRNVVADERYREAFKNYCAQVMQQSEYIAAIYNQIACQDDFVEPTMQIITLNQQLKTHTRIAVQLLRMMLVLLQGRADEIKIETAFNEVYECFNNRLFTIESKFRS